MLLLSMLLMYAGGNTPQDACTLCPAGTYSANIGTERCTPCQAGFTSAEGAGDESECYPAEVCPAGTGERDPACCLRVGVGQAAGFTSAEGAGDQSECYPADVEQVHKLPVWLMLWVGVFASGVGG